MDISDDDMQIERRIDELIDRGLECYGAGDMEGALSQWKHALALDPDNERAANYLEYVEDHHDLAGDLEARRSESTVELAYPFGISTLGLAKLTDQELEDYESFEIVDTATKRLDSFKELDLPNVPSIDDGWNVDEGWVQDLVQKSEPSFAATSSDEPIAQMELATVDVSLADGDVDLSDDGVSGEGDVDLSDDGDVDLSDDGDVDLSDDGDVDLSDSEVDFSSAGLDLADDVDLSDDINRSDDDAPSSVAANIEIGLSEDIEISLSGAAGLSSGTRAKTESSDTNVHKPSAKIRALAGFDELELDADEDETEHAPEQEEEEEPTHALVGATAGSGPHTSTYDSGELEIELDEEEENTSFHESVNRVGVSHSAATSDFVGIELEGLSLGEAGGTETSIPDLPSRSSSAADDPEGKKPTIDFPDGLDNIEDETIGLRGETSSKSRTSRPFASDEEMTIDRSAMVRNTGHARAPTQDHGISEASISVDDALLSLQDSTRELDLGDMGLALPGDAAGDDASPSDARPGDAPPNDASSSGPEPALEEVDIRIGRSSELETAPGAAHGAREFARHDSATEATDDGILAEITRDAPSNDVGERVLYIVKRLIEHADDEFVDGRGAEAASAVCHGLDYASDSAVAQKVIFENERRLVQILISSLGDAGQVPRLLCPLSEIPPEHINHRAAFLLTRLEQAMTLDELLDVSGMPKLEALRHLCGLHVLNFLEVV